MWFSTPSSIRIALRTFLISIFLSVTGISCVWARGLDNNVSISTVNLTLLPVEAQETLRLIKQGGPFPYRKDGSVFQNRERHLPPQSRGYYREYTVPTPDSQDRGARRIIAGAQQEYFYTADHYRSFRRIQP